MCEPKESSQLKEWLFNETDLKDCRAQANRFARIALATQKKTPTDTTKNTTSTIPSHTKVQDFAYKFSKQNDEQQTDGSFLTDDNTESGNPFLSSQEEQLLVSFYASKLPSLIGPMADVPRLRRESKVPATAALLLRRFFLSNSVMIHDPKAIMVAAAFLAAKVEDAMTDIRYLEDGTEKLGAPVTAPDIISAEVVLLSGIHFDLLCFHPYKAVLSMTEDMRTYLKSEKGKRLVSFGHPDKNRPVVGQDLKPMHDAAQLIVNNVIVSDIPLLYTPAQIGLAALMVANAQQQGKDGVPQIDIMGYLSQRFQDADLKVMDVLLQQICTKLKELEQGKHGCANVNVDMTTLKGIHKKLKKVRAWGVKTKKKKRKNEGTEPAPKRAKT